MIEETPHSEPNTVSPRAGQEPLIREDAAESFRKRKRNTSFSLSLANTNPGTRRRCPELSDPLESGGWGCSGCGAILPHDDLLCIPEASWFRVIGYYCHKCKQRWLREKYVPIEQRAGQAYLTIGKWESKKREKPKENESKKS